ncbi:MAG: FAD:protein FMN transferase [Thermodesulfobacteriota bacterium]
MKKAMTIDSIFTRREFLRSCGLLGLGLAAAGAAPAAASAAARMGRDGQTVSRTLPLMGTFVTLTAVHESRDLAEEAVGRAFAEMERLCAVFDRHRGDTAVSVLNRDGRLSGAPAELSAVVERSLSLHSLSGGAFDPSVAPLVDTLRNRAAAGKGLDLSRAELAELLALVDARQIRMDGDRLALGKAGMALTLDGIAKGYIADRASAVLTSCGAVNHLVNAGGDIRAAGEKAPGKAWTVAVEDPAKAGQYPAVVSLKDGAVATSGSYEVYFDRNRAHHHVVAPASGVSPHEVVSCTVKAPTVMEADALATAVMVLGARQGLAFVDSLPGRECLLVTATGAQLASRFWG